MSVQEKIFEDFLKQLEAAKAPMKVINGLKKLWENGELESKENIQKVLKEVVEDVTKHQEC